MNTLGPYTLNSIVHGDCLDVMPELPSGSFDMILCDLPYGTTACAWDSIIPLEPLWVEYKRLIKPAGAIVLTGSQPFTSMLVMSNPGWFKWEDIWHKSQATGHLNCTVMPMRQHENILVFGNGAIAFNPQLQPKKPENIRPVGRRAASDCYGEFNEFAERLIPADMSFPRSIIEVNNTNHGERGLHPTQKPVALFSYLIRTYTHPGAAILDNCAGSGTTAIAAIETGRNWFCIEKDAGYFEIASRRIEERLQQPFLFDPPALVIQPTQAAMELA